MKPGVQIRRSDQMKGISLLLLWEFWMIAFNWIWKISASTSNFILGQFSAICVERTKNTLNE